MKKNQDIRKCNVISVYSSFVSLVRVFSLFIIRLRDKIKKTVTEDNLALQYSSMANAANNYKPFS